VQKLEDILTLDFLYRAVGVIVTIVVFYTVYKITARAVRGVAEKKFKPQTRMVIEKVIKYTFNVIIGMYILSLFGVNFSTLLGAAGIAGVAIGFAAQTSFSNIISGLFLLSEHSLRIGDYVTIGDVTGTVRSVDLLSVKILTPDNQLIRVPNETIIKGNLINTTYFPYRRMTVRVQIAYDSDLQKVIDIMKKIPARCPLVLSDPEPIVYFDAFAASGIDVILGVWFKKDNFITVKNTVYIAIHQVFAEESITIPFMRIDIAVTEKNMIHKDDTERG
jgi:small-conductance mechanosensitive channel